MMKIKESNFYNRLFACVGTSICDIFVAQSESGVLFIIIIYVADFTLRRHS